MVVTSPTTALTPAAVRSRRRPRRSTWVLGVILLVALAVRLISIRHGLPHAYNADEELHYVPQATRAADGDWYSGYFENPSGFTYLVALVYRILFADQDVSMMLVDDPTSVFLVARVVAAVLGTIAVGLVAWAGRHFIDRPSGLVAAALMALAYLPVFYSHQALNDVPTLVPLTVAMVGALRVYRDGRLVDLCLTGIALGAATGVKYLAAPFAVVVALAVLLRVVEGRQRWRPALAGLLSAGVASVGGLLALNPFLVPNFGKFAASFTGQSSQAATEKLGQDGTAWLGYPTSLLWGFGAVPTLLAVLGAVLLWRADRARTLLLLGLPVLLYVFMASQDRFFGRWILPAYPALAIVAGYGATRVAAAITDRIARRRAVAAGWGASAAVLGIVMAVALAQPAVDVTRSNVVLSRTDTREAALQWMRSALPAGSKIVVEPAVPGSYRRELRDLGLTLYPIERPFQDYELSLTPAKLTDYRSAGYCWVMVNGHQHDRGIAAGLLEARDYYRALGSESSLAFRSTPYVEGADPPAFSYDFSFNYYLPVQRRPGPIVEIRHLSDCHTG